MGDLDVYAVPRNDLGAAVAFYERNRPISADAMEVLLMLQDDPAALIELARGWLVRDLSAEAAARNEERVRRMRGS